MTVDTFGLSGVNVSCIPFSGVERSFSSMNRLCTRLRQRLTPCHLDNLLLIAQEGPEVLHRDKLKAMVYSWHSRASRRIQIPDDYNEEAAISS